MMWQRMRSYITKHLLFVCMASPDYISGFFPRFPAFQAQALRIPAPSISFFDTLGRFAFPAAALAARLLPAAALAARLLLVVVAAWVELASLTLPSLTGSAAATAGGSDLDTEKEETHPRRTRGLTRSGSAAAGSGGRSPSPPPRGRATGASSSARGGMAPRAAGEETR